MSNETKKITNVIFKDEQLKAFCVKHHLTDQDILNNLSRFFIQKENNSICAPCDGKNCKMDPYGMQTRLEFQDSLELVYFPCPKIEPDVGKNLETLFFSNKTIYENKELFISNPRAKALKLFDQFVSNYEKNVFQKGLYIHGAFGTGKTFLLWRFAKELSKKQVKVTLVYYPDLVRTIKSYLNTSDFEQLINHLKYCEVLMLDDVGAEMNTAFIRDEILGPILQFRCDANLPVCMSSNYDLNLLKLHFSETKNEIDQVKSDRIIQRIKWLMNEVELDDKNYRL